MAKRDIQVNPFTNEIMTGGLKSYSESLTIPASANFPAETPSLFILFLTEVPYLDNQSLYPFSISGYTKVSTTPTSAGQYRVAPFGSARPNAVQFHPDDAGNSVTIDYYGWGGLIEISEDFVDTSTNQSIAGIKTFSNTTDSSSKDTGAVILEGGLGVEKDISSGTYIRAVNGIEEVKDSGVTGLKRKVITIGDWDMDTTSGVTIALGIDITKIRGVEIIINEDLSAGVLACYPIDYYSTTIGSVSGNYSLVNNPSNIIYINRLTSGFFDSTNFNATSYNRGWILITYEP